MFMNSTPKGKGCCKLRFNKSLNFHARKGDFSFRDKLSASSPADADWKISICQSPSRFNSTSDTLIFGLNTARTFLFLFFQFQGFTSSIGTLQASFGLNGEMKTPNGVETKTTRSDEGEFLSITFFYCVNISSRLQDIRSLTQWT